METARFGSIIRVKLIHQALEDGILVELTARTLQGSAYVGGRIEQPNKYRKTIIFILLQVGSCGWNVHHQIESRAKQKKGVRECMTGELLELLMTRSRI